MDSGSRGTGHLCWVLGEDISLPQSLSQSNCINQGNGKFNAEGEVTNAMD